MELMDPALVLRSKPAVPLNERFTQLLKEQKSCSRAVTYNPVRLQRGKGGKGVWPRDVTVRQRGKGVWLNDVIKTETLSPPAPFCLQPWVLQQQSLKRKQQKKKQRRSVWSRLGFNIQSKRFAGFNSQSKFFGGFKNQSERFDGFWSFRNKYRRRTGFRRWGNIGLGQRRRQNRRKFNKGFTARSSPVNRFLRKRGGASSSSSSSWGRGLKRDITPTRKQLDKQLDEYMSLSKSRLDRQLDQYMSGSKRRLDADLDEYMSMAGQTDLLWDD